MGKTLGRRRVLAGMAALGASLPIGAALAMEGGPACVIQESGTLSSWPLVIAAVVTADPQRVDGEIEALRRTTGYWRALKLSSSDANRIGFGKALIDLFAADDGLRLVAQVATAHGGWPAVAADRDRRYFARYREVAALALGDTATANVHLGRQENLRGELLRDLVGNEVGVVAKTPAASANLRQLAGLLAGCIRADHVGATDAARRELIDHCKDALGVQKLSACSTDKVLVRAVAI